MGKRGRVTDWTCGKKGLREMVRELEGVTDLERHLRHYQLGIKGSTKKTDNKLALSQSREFLLSYLLILHLVRS